MKKIYCSIVLLLGFSVCSFAQLSLPSASIKPVLWHFKLKPTSEKGVFVFTAKANMDTVSGFHIWALDPGGDGSLIATEFNFEEDEEIVWLDENWSFTPKPKTISLDFIEGDINWHEKVVTFSKKVKIPEGNILRGTVTFQTCTEDLCHPPQDEVFEIKAGSN